MSEFLYSSVYLSLHVHACCADTDAMITELDSLNVVRADYLGQDHQVVIQSIHEIFRAWRNTTSIVVAHSKT